jgi:hypothetical protein
MRMPKKCQSAGTQPILAHFPEKACHFDAAESARDFVALPHGARAAALFRGGAMLASAKPKNVSGGNFLRNSVFLRSKTLGRFVR